MGIENIIQELSKIKALVDDLISSLTKPAPLKSKMSNKIMAQSAANPDGTESEKAMKIHQPCHQVTHLSVERDVKIYYAALTFGTVGTSKDVYIFNNAQVHGSVGARGISIYGNARVTANISATSSLAVRENGNITGDIYSMGDASFSMSCRASGRIHVAKNLKMSGTAHISGDVDVDGDVWMCDNARISGNLTVGGCLHMFDKAHVCEYTMSSRNLVMDWSSESASSPRKHDMGERVRVYDPSTGFMSPPQPSHVNDDEYSGDEDANESVDEEADCDTPEDSWSQVSTTKEC